MNLKDSIRKDKTIVFHSTQASFDFGTALLDGLTSSSFGKGGGSMLGNGFYANQYLVQAQKGNYGKNILQAEVYGIRNFFFTEIAPYKEVFGTGFASRADLIKSEIDRFGIDKDFSDLWASYPKLTSSYLLVTALSRPPVWELIKKASASGIVYYGDYDNHSIVSWYPKRDIHPTQFSEDGGKTWKPVPYEEVVASNTREANLKKSEAVRSLQRARDLKARYENQPETKIVSAIRSHLKATLRTPAKFDARRAAMIRVFPEFEAEIKAFVF